MSFWTMPLPGLMRKKAGGLNSADVFKTTLYTGNGSTQTITNGIDLAGEGGLVWIKQRTAMPFNTNHCLYDTIRGGGVACSSNTSDAQAAYGDISFGNSGFGLIGGTGGNLNYNGGSYVGWAFRRAQKFFDIVTYTGNGTSGRQIAHGLGVAPGFVATKSLSATGDWNSYHRSASGDLVLNSTATQAGSRSIITAADAATFTVSGTANTNGVTYVAYLFAHDPSPGGIIQCGSYTGNGSASGPAINLGWQPQYLLVKNTSQGTPWTIFDSARGLSSGDDAYLQPNAADAEASGQFMDPLPTGFQPRNNGTWWNASGSNYVYMAIRAEGV